MSRVSDGGTCAPEIMWHGEVVNMRATVSDPETRRSRKDGSCDGKKKWIKKSSSSTHCLQKERNTCVRRTWTVMALLGET